MAQASNALIQIETGRDAVVGQVMVDSGDGKVFTVTNYPLFSGRAGYEPDVKPNGIVTGSNLLSPGSGNDEVDTEAFTAYSKGVLQSPAATDGTITITRPATDVAKINSVVMESDGSLDVVAGTDGATTTFSETRGAAGGPPLIPVEAVELGQVRVTTSAAGIITAAQIKQVPTVHNEYSNSPAFTINNIGQGKNATVAAKENAYVEFYSAIPAIHTGSVRKPVYIDFYAPLLGPLAVTRDFTPVENTHSVSSEQYYGNQAIASRSSSIGQGGFTVVLEDGVNDIIMNERDQVATVKFFPDANKSAYILQQGTIGIARAFPVDGQMTASVTMTSQVVSAEFAS